MDGAEIRAAREARGWTQEQLAAQVGVGQRTVGNWERGETIPKNRAGRLREVLGINGARPADPDVLGQASDVELLAELMRRAAARERTAG